MSNWKEIAKRVAASHNEDQESAVVINSSDAVGEIRCMTEDEDLGVFSGKTLKAKDVRRFLWSQRHTTADEGVFIWTKYDEDEDESVVGIGKFDG